MGESNGTSRTVVSINNNEQDLVPRSENFQSMAGITYIYE